MYCSEYSPDNGREFWKLQVIKVERLDEDHRFLIKWGCKWAKGAEHGWSKCTSTPTVLSLKQKKDAYWNRGALWKKGAHAIEVLIDKFEGALIGAKALHRIITVIWSKVCLRQLRSKYQGLASNKFNATKGELTRKRFDRYNAIP